MKHTQIKPGQTYESHTRGKRRRVLQIDGEGPAAIVTYHDTRHDADSYWYVTLKAFAQWAATEVQS